MKKILLNLCLMLASLLSINCYVSDSMPDIIYYDSFESAKDMPGWSGISAANFINDSPTGFGKHSVTIGGGCFYPTASRKINVPAEGNYVLTCWGKTKINGGSIGITNNPGSLSDKRIIQINSDGWEHYTTNELFCPANSTITIEIFAGGFVPAEIYIDEIKIKKI